VRLAAQHGPSQDASAPVGLGLQGDEPRQVLYLGGAHLVDHQPALASDDGRIDHIHRLLARFGEEPGQGGRRDERGIVSRDLSGEGEVHARQAPLSELGVETPHAVGQVDIGARKGHLLARKGQHIHRVARRATLEYVHHLLGDLDRGDVLGLCGGGTQMRRQQEIGALA